MTYSSADPAPMTPVPTGPPVPAKLADSRWRYLNSWWVLLPPLSLGFLSWLAFLIVAVRSGKWTLWASSGLYAALLAGATVLNAVDRDGVGGTIAVTLLLVGCWLAASVHAVIANRGFLRTLATKSVWYDGAGTQQGHPALDGAPSAPPFLGISQDQYYAAPGYSATPTMPPPRMPPPVGPPTFPSPGGPPATERVDVNAATVQALRAVPGVEEELAGRIVAARDLRGGFRDLEDLVAAANLRPHELVRLRDRLAFGGFSRQQGGTGRILDI